MLRLPEDVAISVQRILGMDSNSPDPFSSFDFSENHVISILNHLVPDGVHSEFDLPVPQLSHVWRPQRQHALQKELDVLKDELHRDQDPERMQLIQGLISVRLCH